jgi:hypothetical protein
VPPARKHLVRYYGALGPRSPLRSAVTQATREGATNAEMEAGYSVTLIAKASREARRARSAAGRAWAACLRKIFEVDPVRCGKCAGEMKLVAVILDDRELDRILAHQGWPTEFPKTKASRAPPGAWRAGVSRARWTHARRNGKGSRSSQARSPHRRAEARPAGEFEDEEGDGERIEPSR